MSLRALLRRLRSSCTLQLQTVEIDWQDLENVNYHTSFVAKHWFLRVRLCTMHDLGVSVLRRLLMWWRFRFAWHFRSRAMNQARAWVGKGHNTCSYVFHPPFGRRQVQNTSWTVMMIRYTQVFLSTVGILVVFVWISRFGHRRIWQPMWQALKPGIHWPKDWPGLCNITIGTFPRLRILVSL